MRGDFARLTFDPKKHYTGVLHQQGRVWLEADWNEDVHNRQHLLQQETRDIIGACGVPEPGTAFMISPNPNPTSQPCDFLIAGGPGPQGRYYVDGILCELEATPFTPIGFPSGSSMQVSAWLVDDREFQVGQWVEISGIVQGNQKTQLVQISAVDPGNRILTFSTDVSVFQRATAPSARHLPTYLSQPDFPNAPAIQWPASGSDLWAVVYLEVWQRFITHLEDEALREIALGGPDTAARLKTVAQVKFLPITKELTCTEARGLLPKKSQAKLATIQPKDSQPEDLCRLPDPATYIGRENRLYRIEIHNGGDVAGTDPSVELKLPLALDVEKRVPILKLKNALNPQQIDALTRSGVVRLMDDDGHQEIVTIANVSSDTLTLHISPSYRYTIAKNALVIGNIARFKWSRDNASFAVSVKAVSDDRKTLTLSGLGRDQATWLRQLDLVEISDDASELGPAVGHLTELLDTDPDQLTVTLAEPLPSEFLLTKEGYSERHMILRRWDGQGWASAAPDGIELEDGVHIQFGGSDLRPGDYWQFAARSIDGSVEKLDGVPPKGIERHYCPLAIVKWEKQYQFDRQKLIEALTNGQFGNQAISRLENILREQYGESNQIVADIPEILSTAQHADLSDTQRQKLHESLLQVEPLVTFKVLEDCRSQFPTLTELTNLFYVSGDGQEVTPDLTNGEQFLHLRQPLCVGVANGNKPVKDATVQFKIIGDPFPQGVAKGKLQNDGISVDILTGQDGLACCDWQLWFNSNQPEDVQHAVLSQQVEAYLLDNDGNPMGLPVRFTANLSVAAEVAYDPKECTNLQGATTVQKAIDQLCKLERSSGCEVTVGKGGQFARLEEAVAALRRTEQRSWCICLLPDEHILPEGLELEEEGVHIHIMACSPGTRVILQQPLVMKALASIRLSDFAVEANGVPIAAVFERCQEVTFSDLTIRIAGVERPEGAILFGGCSAVTLRNVALTASGVTQVFNFEECRSVTLDTCQLSGTEDVSTIMSIGAGARRIYLDGNVLRAARVALIIGDGNADTTLNANIITGITSLYGEPGERVLNERDLNSVAGRLRDRPNLLQAAKGVFQAQGNRLTRLIVGETKIQQILEGEVTDLYKAFFLTDNVIEGAENVFVAQQVSVMTTFFAQTGQEAGGRAGATISQAATFVGNHAPDLKVLLFDVSPSHQDAANLLTIQHF